MVGLAAEMAEVWAEVEVVERAVEVKVPGLSVVVITAAVSTAVQSMGLDSTMAPSERSKL